MTYLCVKWSRAFDPVWAMHEPDVDRFLKSVLSTSDIMMHFFQQKLIEELIGAGCLWEAFELVLIWHFGLLTVHRRCRLFLLCLHSLNLGFIVLWWDNLAWKCAYLAWQTKKCYYTKEVDFIKIMLSYRTYSLEEPYRLFWKWIND